MSKLKSHDLTKQMDRHIRDCQKLSLQHKVAMELSHIFGFLKIVKESINLVPRNGRIMASITLLSLLLPSLLHLLLLYWVKFLTKKMDEAIMVSLWSNLGLTPNQIITFFSALLIAAVIGWLTAIGKISSFSVPAVILVTAMSYTGKKASVADLLARINRERARQHSGSSSSGKALVVAAVATYVMNMDHNAITGTATIVGCIIIFFYLRYVSVVGFLATIVAVVEERREGVMEKAEKLVVGHRLQGFMLNLLVVFPIWNVFLAYRMYLDKGWYLNIATHGLLLLNSSFLGNIFFSVSYTVLYFRCKKHHGQEIDALLGKE